jgi:hypothetical protein
MQAVTNPLSFPSFYSMVSYTIISNPYSVIDADRGCDEMLSGTGCPTLTDMEQYWNCQQGKIEASLRKSYSKCQRAHQIFSELNQDLNRGSVFKRQHETGMHLNLDLNILHCRQDKIHLFLMPVCISTVNFCSKFTGTNDDRWRETFFSQNKLVFQQLVCLG